MDVRIYCELDAGAGKPYYSGQSNHAMGLGCGALRPPDKATTEGASRMVNVRERANTADVRERTSEEVIHDTILALCMLWLSREQKGGSEGDKWKAMKMLFVAEYEMFVDGIKAFNMRFYRHQQGPYSDEAETAWNTLAERDLLVLPQRSQDQFAITDDGAELASEFMAEVLRPSPPNDVIADKLIKTAEKYGRVAGVQVKEDVYGMRVRTLENQQSHRTVRNIPYNETFTRPLDPDEAARSLLVPEDWHDTLSIILDPGYDHQATKKPSGLSHEDIFAPV